MIMIMTLTPQMSDTTISLSVHYSLDFAQCFIFIFVVVVCSRERFACVNASQSYQYYFFRL